MHKLFFKQSQQKANRMHILRDVLHILCVIVKACVSTKLSILSALTQQIPLLMQRKMKA